MKTRIKLFRKAAAVVFSLLFVSTALFADGNANEVYMSGKTATVAGDFVITGTNDVYHFQGIKYNVYNVYYDNPVHNMKIAVKPGSDGSSFLAYNGKFWFRYDVTREGFGVRKSMFTSPSVRDEFNAEEYHDQSILVKKRRIEKDQAIGLIAAYLPKLQS
jgi:hypothetical protein